MDDTIEGKDNVKMFSDILVASTSVADFKATRFLLIALWFSELRRISIHLFFWST